MEQNTTRRDAARCGQEVCFPGHDRRSLPVFSTIEAFDLGPGLKKENRGDSFTSARFAALQPQSLQPKDIHLVWSLVRSPLARY